MWMQDLIFFLGEFLCLIVFHIQRCGGNKQANSAPVDKSAFFFIIPAMCDLGGTSLAGISLLYLDSSIWLMLRSCLIVFSAILSKIFLKKQLYFFHWLGIFIIVAGLSVVGLSALLDDMEGGGSSQNNKNLLFGIIFAIGSQVLNAIQFIIEEAFITRRGYAPVQIVGLEGLFGMILTSAIALPILQYFKQENTLDALVQLKNNWLIIVFMGVYILCSMLANLFSVSISQVLNTIQRMIITSSVQTLFLWGTDLFIYYVVSTTYGEPWTKFSWVEIIGFVVVSVGIMIYNSVFKIPCLYYPSKQEEEEKKPLVSNHVVVTTKTNYSVNTEV
jgi:drug/metabolite transporter (DMT)-like permease